MEPGSWSKRAVALAISILAGGATRAADMPDASTTQDIASQLNSLKQQVSDMKVEQNEDRTTIASLRAQQNENWLTKERESQIRGIVEEVLKDARDRGQFADGVEAGYSPGNGFYIQSSDKNNKIAIGGYAQFRYQSAFSNAYNGRTFPPRNGGGTGNVVPHDPGNSAGFDVRRARISVAGNVFTPDLTFKMEGDFYGNATGNFTVSDAYVAYRFNDLLRVKIGSYKVPFAKSELTADPLGSFAERAEVMAPFDPIRSLGISLYGDIIKDQLSYEVAINDGSQANTLRRDDTVGATPNLDNRLGYYARVQWAGSGKISDFADDSDLRDDNRSFVWLLGGAVGYESQNSSNSAFPSPQGTGTIPGLPNGTGNNAPYGSPYTLNGDIYRGTIDWSAKYQGLSIATAAYIQQINANPGNFSTSTTGGDTTTVPPFGAGKSSFFQWGTYGQVGYFLVPQKLEILGRAGVLATEGNPNIGEFYSIGANYYIYKHNFKVQSDVTYTPEAAYTDSAASLLANTHDIVYRVQLQLRF